MENRKRKLSSEYLQEAGNPKMRSGIDLEANEKTKNDLEYDFSIENLFKNAPIDTDFKETSPEHEYSRSKLISSFHKNYVENFKRLFFVRFAPKDSLNRFLYEQLSLQKSDSTTLDNIKMNLPKPDNIKELDTIDKEIKTAFPLTCKIKSFKGSQWKIEKNIKECLNIGYNFSNESSTRVQNYGLKNLLNNNKQFKTSEDYFEAFKDERDKYFNSFKKIFEQKILNLKVYLETELEKMIKNMKNETINIGHKVEKTNGEKIILIKYKDSEYQVSKNHFEKVYKLWKLNNRTKESNDFVEVFYCLICRYQTFFRNNEVINEGYGMQAALPGRVFKELNKTFCVTQEMFASPFNCYFKNYCSAFLDTDYYFGSNGSFFDYEPKEGNLSN